MYAQDNYDIKVLLIKIMLHGLIGRCYLLSPALCVGYMRRWGGFQVVLLKHTV
jgi:hypothetical protein